MKRMILSLLVLTLLAACAAQAEPVAFTDMMGRSISLSEPASRIVALTAADCEILCALGAEDCLVGRGEYCDYPSSVLDLPVVASGVETNLEQIIALQPQAVLLSTMNQTVEQNEMLESAGIRAVVSCAEGIDGVYEAIRVIGSLTAKNTEAEQLVEDMRSAFAEIASSHENTGKTVYFEVSPLEWGLWTAGKNTFLDEIAALCGLTNAFSDVEGWVEISQEQVLERNPDYIVTIFKPQDGMPAPEEEIALRPGWDSVSAVKEGSILRVDSDASSRPGPRLVEAARALSDFILKEH